EGIKSACIAVDGGDSSAVMLFEGNRIIGNYCMVRIGESYGIGENVRFYDNTFVREGYERLDYAIISVGFSSADTGNNYFIDSVFEGDTDYSDVIFGGTGTLREMYAGWTLRVETEADANVVIKNVSNTEVYNGQADTNGVVEVELLQYKEEESGRTYYTDHTVTVTKGTRSTQEVVTMDAKKTVQIDLPIAGDLNHDGFCGQDDLNMVLTFWGQNITGYGGSADPNADVAPGDGDGFIGQDDLNIVLSDWGKGTPP
ncbi:unnamed protein product, partial [marine sediment metagenome]